MSFALHLHSLAHQQSKLYIHIPGCWLHYTHSAHSSTDELNNLCFRTGSKCLFFHFCFTLLSHKQQRVRKKATETEYIHEI